MTSQDIRRDRRDADRDPVKGRVWQFASREREREKARTRQRWGEIQIFCHKHKWLLV